jgi:hypothetical protein
MKWNFTKSIALAAAVMGVLRALADGYMLGKPENGIAAFFWIMVLGMLFSVPADIISFLRSRGSAGQQASKVR